MVGPTPRAATPVVTGTAADPIRSPPAARPATDAQRARIRSLGRTGAADFRDLTFAEAEAWIDLEESRRRRSTPVPARTAPAAAELEGRARSVVAAPTDTGGALYTDIVASLCAAYRFETDWHAPILALFVLQSALARALQRVYHVYLTGPPGAGKTGLGIRVVGLCSGRMLGDCSTAALARTTAYGRTIGVDEADALRGGGPEAREARDSLVRDAYRADAPSYVRYNNKKGQNEEYPTYGPRVLIAREDLDTATATRGVPIGCVSPAGDDSTYALLLEGIWPHGVAELSARVAAWGQDRISRVGPLDLLRAASTPEFAARVREIAGTTAASREAELGITMLLVADLAGLSPESLRPHLTAALSAGRIASATGDDQAAGDAMAALRDILNRTTLDGGDAVRVRRKEWLDAANRLRRERGDRPIQSRTFGAVLRDLGAREGWRVGTGGVVSFDLPAAVVAGVRAGSGSLRPTPTPPEMPNLPHLPHLTPKTGSGAPLPNSLPNSDGTDGRSGVSGVSGVSAGGMPIDGAGGVRPPEHPTQPPQVPVEEEPENWTVRRRRGGGP